MKQGELKPLCPLAASFFCTGTINAVGGFSSSKQPFVVTGSAASQDPALTVGSEQAAFGGICFVWFLRINCDDGLQDCSFLFSPSHMPLVPLTASHGIKGPPMAMLSRLEADGKPDASAFEFNQTAASIQGR